MKIDLDLQDGEGCTIISYEHLGISVILKDTLPNVEHWFSTWHILPNFTKLQYFARVQTFLFMNIS